MKNLNVISIFVNAKCVYDDFENAFTEFQKEFLNKPYNSAICKLKVIKELPWCGRTRIYEVKVTISSKSNIEKVKKYIDKMIENKNCYSIIR